MTYTHSTDAADSSASPAPFIRSGVLFCPRTRGVENLISEQINQRRQHGGARPGSGRPRKLEKYGGHILAAENKIRDQLPMIVDRMLELVDGITVSETDNRGNERIYTRPPDREAAKYLMDRIMGKTTDRVDVTSDGEAVTFGFDFKGRNAEGR